MQNDASHKGWIVVPEPARDHPFRVRRVTYAPPKRSVVHLCWDSPSPSKVDGRTLVKQRPRRNLVKRMAVAVPAEPFCDSKNHNAIGHHKSILSCGHIIKRAVSNGSVDPQIGKMYACPECSKNPPE